MPTAQIDTPPARKPLRLWPGVIVAVLVVVARFVVPIVAPETLIFGFLGGLVGALAIAVWWVFFSRAPWSERLGAIVLVLVAYFATKPLLDKSIAGGMMGMMFAVYALPPILAPAFVAWAVATRHRSDAVRWASMAITILLGCAAWTLLRTGGITGNAGVDLHWRWTPTPEQRLLAQGDDESRDTARDRSVDAAREKPNAVAPAPAAAETAKPPAAAKVEEAAALPAVPRTGKRAPRTSSITGGSARRTTPSSSSTVRGPRATSGRRRGSCGISSC